ncbi:hypothetical protein LINGRAPRIM_LOCUS2493 [Linum grandiflorum]
MNFSLASLLSSSSLKSLSPPLLIISSSSLIFFQNNKTRKNRNILSLTLYLKRLLFGRRSAASKIFSPTKEGSDDCSYHCCRFISRLGRVGLLCLKTRFVLRCRCY